jgi:hypothetical protein
MKNICFSLLFSLFACTTYAQVGNIFELMDRTDLSLAQIQQIAQRHFDTVGTGRGTGYKQFQRWMYERKFHIDENGNFINNQTDWQHYLANQHSLPSNRTEAGSWTELGPFNWNRTSGWNPGVGRLSALAVSPTNANLIYAGSPGGGIWKTINGGTNWTALSDNNATWMSVFALAIDPVNNNRVYAGFSGSNGIIISSDGGNSWAAAGAGPSGTVRKVLIHPTSTNIVYAACTNGIWRSINSGASWTQVHSGSKEDIEFKPDNTNIMYATGNDVFRSIDGGLSWTNLGTAEGITNTGRTLVAVSAANPNYVYVCQANGSSFGRMYKSTDAGVSFTTTVVGNSTVGTNYFGYETNGTGAGGQATYDMALEVNPTNAAEVYIAGIICWKSINETTSFTAITAWSLPNTVGYNHADVHGLFWVGSILYSISDGGVYKSLNNGEDWIDITAGMGIRQFYRIATSPTHANVVTGGAQDNGSSIIQAGGAWVDWLGADGMEGLVSPTNHLNIWGTSQNGAIYRSTNGGNSRVSLTQPSAGQWVTPLAIHPTNEAILYGGWTGVYKSTNSGTTWVNISGTTITTTLAVLAVAPSNPNYIYASNGSTLWVTTDDGASWTTRTATATINDIAIDPTDPSKIWVALNSTTNKIMVSANAGATFTNISSNLPTIIARTVVVDDHTPRRLYVGLNIGVYEKLETDINWTDVSANLPKVAINELDIHKIDGTLKVATYGRGLWEMPLTVPSGFSFGTTTPTTIACPAPVNLTALLPVNAIGSFNNPVSISVQSTSPAGLSVAVSSPITPGNNATVSLMGANTLSPGTYTVTMVGTAAGAANQTTTVTFTITPGTGAAIVAQPTSQSVCVGNAATFMINATGTAITYQWQLSIDGGISYQNIIGANSPSYIANAVTLSMNNYRYRCLVSGACSSTIISDAATLTTIAPVTIVTQSLNTAVCTGGSTIFSVETNPAAVQSQWQLSTDGGNSWVNIIGANTTTLNLSNITAGMNGNLYRVLLSNNGCATTTSNTILLTVRSSPTITLAASLTTLLPGQTSLLTSTPSLPTGGTVTTSWLYNNNPLAIAGNTYTANVEQVGVYQTLIQESWGGGLVCSAASPPITISANISNRLFIFPSPNDGNFTVSFYNAGSNATTRTLSVIDSKGALIYQRIFSINGAYTLLPVNMQNVNRGIYYVIVGDAAGKRLAQGKVHVR